MEVKEFLKKIREKLSEKAWRRLKAFAKKGKIKYGEFASETGPKDGSGY